VPLNVKKSFATGIFVIVPLLISVALLVWFFQRVDAFFSPPIDGILKAFLGYDAHVPGTGLLTGLFIILVVGFFARNVVGARILEHVERFSQRIPVYSSLYSTVKQLTDAFSPDNKNSFKEVLLVEYPRAGVYTVSFRTGTVEMEGRRLAVVYVPTNHLYLGDLVLVPEDEAVRLDMTVEAAMRLFLSVGTAAPRRFSRRPPAVERESP
jgi:uncharacterized membrane protein